MKRIGIITALLLCVSMVALGQNGKKAGKNLLKTLYGLQHVGDARWLSVYDSIAHRAVDQLLAENRGNKIFAGKEWFCYELDNKKEWHAIFGRYENDRMNVAAHYRIDSLHGIQLVVDPIDSALFDTYARALLTASKRFEKTKKTSGLQFQHYIKRGPDGQFKVWYLLSDQANGLAVYGEEFVYTISADGTRVTQNDSYCQQVRYFDEKVRQDTSIQFVLQYPSVKYPTVGGVFFLYKYSRIIPKCMLETKEVQISLQKLPGGKVQVNYNINP